MDELTKLRSQLAEMTVELEELYKPDENGVWAADFTQKCDDLRAKMRAVTKEIEKIDPNAFATSYHYELPPETNAPEGSHTLVPIPGDRHCARNSEQAIIELQDGRLLMGWSEFYEGAGDDWSPCRLARKISSDGGVTWSETTTMLENEAQQATMEVDFVRVPSGDICLFYLKKNSNNDCRVMMRKSKDDGATWGEAKQLSDWQGCAATTNDRAILTTKGRIILPFYYSMNDEFAQPCFGACQVFYSDDEGETWGISMPPLSAPFSASGAFEPAVVELYDGSIMMFLRNSSGRIWQSISRDGGARWGRPTATELATSGSPICLKRIPNSSDIMCIWNQCSKQEIEWGFVRDRLSCAISSDDGKTWGHFKNLESLNDITQVKPAPIGESPKSNLVSWGSPMPVSGPLNCCYPSCTFVGDNAIICYDFPTGYCGIKMRILPISWFYDDNAPSLRTIYPDGRTDRDLYQMTQISASPRAFG